MHQFLVSALGDHLSVIHDADPIGEFLGFGHIVGGIEDGHALVAEIKDGVQNGPAALGVDSHRGLIEVKGLGPVQQSHTDVDATFHASGVLVHPLFLAVFQADQLNHLVHPAMKLSAAHTVHLAPEHEVLAGAEIQVQRHLLRDYAD
ncbi:MAG: hypothetical protein BWY79_00357 [Actinobacteria bacterium ADurb.Bin444]|nr:MAG: hypothetical protein BWY79_00357 [Actinobacteria bacterium ADurb.Bin444]